MILSSRPRRPRGTDIPPVTKRGPGARAAAGRCAAAAFLVLAALWGTLGLSGAAADAADSPRPAGRANDALTASPGDERFRGLVAPSKRVRLGAPLDGILIELAVEEGDTIAAGELIARMEDDVQVVVVQVSDLEIERQTMLLEEAEIRLEQMLELAVADAALDWEIRQARLNRDGAEVEMRRAGRNHELERTRLSRYRVRAPFDGLVLRVERDAGSSLRHGDPILDLIALDPLEAELYLPVELYGQLEIGRTYPLRAEAPVSGVLDGRLKMIEPLIDSASGTFRCVFTIENPDLELPAGFSVRLLLQDDLSER